MIFHNSIVKRKKGKYLVIEVLMESSIETSSERTWVATTSYFNRIATLKKRKREQRSEDMHAHMNARMRTHTRARMHAQTHKHTHARTHVLERTNTHKQRHACSLNAKRMARKWISLMMEEKQKKRNPCKLRFLFQKHIEREGIGGSVVEFSPATREGPGSIPGQCIRKFLFLFF